MDAYFIHAGFGHLVSAEQLLAVLPPDSAPTKRLLHRGKEERRIVDLTDGHRLKAVLIMADGGLVLAAVTPATIAGRASIPSSL
jgi:extracellular matrix regulatory protein A